MSLVRILLVLMLLGVAAWAQSPWDTFYQSLDTFEFEQAQQLAKNLPEGAARDLALAEIALVRRRADQSFAWTDRIDPQTLSPELAAKRLMIVAMQEQATDYLSEDEKRKVVNRMIREGLRTATPRDRVRLLLLRIESLNRDDLASARDAANEIADIEGVDSSFLLQAQAQIARLANRPKEAAAHWRTLAQMAGLRGQKRAENVFSQRAILSSYIAEPRPGLLDSCQKLLRQAAQTDDAYAVAKGWQTLVDITPHSQQQSLLVQGESLIDSISDLTVQLEILNDLLTLCYNLDKPKGLLLARRGAKIARQSKDPVVEAYFIWRAGDFGSREEYQSAQTEARALLANFDPRGLGGTYFHSVVQLERVASQVPSRPNRDRLGRDLEALKLGASPTDRFAVYESSIYQGIKQPDPELLEAAFWPALDLVLQMPSGDRDWALKRLSFYFLRPLGYQSLAKPPEDRGELQEATIRGLGLKLAQRPELVDRILESVAANLVRDSSGLGHLYLAEWLLFLGREQEARAMLILASGPGMTLGWACEAKLQLGRLSIANGEVAGLTLIQDGIAGLGSSRDPEGEVSCQLGWLALSLGRAAEAEALGRKALAHAPEAVQDLKMFLRAGPHKLVALALAGQGRTEAALAALDQGQAESDRQGLGQSDSYLLVRADVLGQAGRYDEAAAILARVPSKPAPHGVYEWRLRRWIADKVSDLAATAKNEANQAAYLGRESMLPTDPIYADLFRQAVAQRPASFQAPTAASASAMGFADLVKALERLRLREPQNATLKRMSAAELRGLMSQAKADEIFVQPVLLEHSVVTIFLTHQQAGLVELFCDRPRLDRAMLSLTSSLSTPASDPAASEQDRRYLADRLIAPWRSKFPDRRRLRWMGEGSLQKLPLTALPTNGAMLLDVMTVSFLDGPLMGQSVQIDGTSPALMVGGASDLDGAKEELRAVRKQFPRGQNWQLGGELASLAKLIPQHRLIHISAHGSGPGSGSLGGKLRGDGHELSAFDLSGMSFSEHSLAVIGACDSYADSGTGHDNSSLVSALRTAGADAVVGSLWPIDDAVTAELLGLFYQRLKQGASPEEALAIAQRAIALKWKHPFYWAGFQLVTGP